MELTLLVLGVLFLTLGLFAAKKESPPPDALELQALAQELIQAKKDIEGLLNQLDEATERAVNKLEDKVSHALALVEEYDRINKRLHKVYTLPVPKNQESSEAVKPNLKEEIIPKNSGQEKRQLIYELAEAGQSVDEIAKIAQVGKGEVSLILEIKNRSVKK